MATDLCFPVLKYSHATGVRSDNSIPWTHLQASDLYAIVKGKNGSVVDEKLDLRVVQGTKVLESVDIAHYVDAAIDARRGAEQHGVTPQVEQLPIFGITKDALLALRYRPSDGQARRIQLRMENATHCRQIVDAFVRRGMEFQEQRGRPGTARPVTAASQERPLTVTSSSPYFASGQPAARTSPERSPTREPYRHEQASQEMPPPSLLVRDEAVAPREVALSRPTTSQIYRSYTSPSQPSMYEVLDVPRRPSDPTDERPASSSHLPTLQAIREAAEDDMTPPRSATGMLPPSLRPSYSNDWSSGTPEPAALAALHSDPSQHLSSRPSTAATNPAPAPDISQELPPRRELPFKRPDSKSSSGGKGNTGAMSMPPLPKPKLAKQGPDSPVRADSLSPIKGAHDARPGTASPLKRAYNAADDGTERPQTAIGVSAIPVSREPSPTKKARTNEPAASPERAVREPSRMNELLARNPLSERSTNSRIPRNNSLADAPGEIVSPPASPPKHSASSLAHNTTINAYTSIRENVAHPREVSLGEYATQSLSDRQAALEEFMMQNLENPAFTKLCEDVENCWRRIALGL